MSQSSSKQIIAKSYSGEGHGITYANQEKISLDLRKLRFEVEAKQQDFPPELAQAINFGIQLRADTIENHYKTVMWYVHIKQFGSFFQDFGCKSLEEWMVKFDLPVGATLAKWEIMVRLFSKETFLLVGDEILGEMIYWVSCFQTDPEKKKADYQNIFELYCKVNDSFDKTEFRKIVNWYVNTTYASKTIDIEPERVKDRPPRDVKKGVQTVKVARPIAEIVTDEPATVDQAEAPDIPNTSHASMDFVIEERLCAGCRARDAYIAQLRRVIVAELGLNRVPERPRDI